MMKIKEIMSTPAKTIEADASVREAAKAMKQNNVGILPVMRAGQLVGIVSDRDLVVRALSEDRLAHPVSEFMSSNPVSLNEHRSVEDAIETMRANGIGRLVITDELSRIVGVVSAADLAVACAGDPRVGSLAAALGLSHRTTEELARM
jgi:CBS domain-containing protein